MEAHGGYLCRLDSFGTVDVVGLAREALQEDGLDPASASLQISSFAGRKVIRLAYDTPRVYGRMGAHWYKGHHALAVRMSHAFPGVIHVYVHDPEELELVVTYGRGRRGGGELVRYEDVEGLEDTTLDDEGYARLQERWPLGHLAQVFGITRLELLKLPRCPSLLLDLGSQGQVARLDALRATSAAVLSLSGKGRGRRAR